MKNEMKGGWRKLDNVATMPNLNTVGYFEFKTLLSTLGAQRHVIHSLWGDFKGNIYVLINEEKVICSTNLLKHKVNLFYFVFISSKLFSRTLSKLFDSKHDRYG